MAGASGCTLAMGGGVDVRKRAPGLTQAPVWERGAEATCSGAPGQPGGDREASCREMLGRPGPVRARPELRI